MTRPLRRTSAVGPRLSSTALTATMLTVAGSVGRARAFFQPGVAASATSPWRVASRSSSSSSRPAFAVPAGGSSASTFTCATRGVVDRGGFGSRRAVSSRWGGKAVVAVSMVEVGGGTPEDDRCDSVKSLDTCVQYSVQSSTGETVVVVPWLDLRFKLLSICHHRGTVL